jgi:hypothetical protein
MESKIHLKDVIQKGLFLFAQHTVPDLSYKQYYPHDSSAVFTAYKSNLNPTKLIDLGLRMERSGRQIGKQLNQESYSKLFSFNNLNQDYVENKLLDLFEKNELITDATRKQIPKYPRNGDILMFGFDTLLAGILLEQAPEIKKYYISLANQYTENHKPLETRNSSLPIGLDMLHYVKLYKEDYFN